LNTAARVGHIRWVGVSDVTALRTAACRRILHIAKLAIRQRGRFVIAVAGGETPRGVYRMLLQAGSDWPKWHVYYTDELCLSADHPLRNSRTVGNAWLDHVDIPQAQRHTIPAEYGVRAAALAYGNTLHGIGLFDLVVLGLGADGHTAGLFPARAWGEDRAAADTLEVYDAPLPPRERVSLSAARLRLSREVLFVVSGESKRRALARWRAGDDIAAGTIRLAGGIDVLTESALL
jgi:6-phosphogluconolactonase